MNLIDELKAAKVSMGDRMVEITEDLRDRIVADLEILAGLVVELEALEQARAESYTLSEETCKADNAILHDLVWNCCDPIGCSRDGFCSC